MPRASWGHSARCHPKSSLLLPFSGRGSLGQNHLALPVTQSLQTLSLLLGGHSGQSQPYKELFLWLPQAAFLFLHHLALVQGPFPSASTMESQAGALEKAAQAFFCTEAGLGHPGRGWLGSLGNRELTNEVPIPLALIVRGCSQVWARSENHRGPCSPLCPHFKQKALLEPGSQVGGGGGAEISGLVLGCYFVLRTSGTICPCPRCPFPFSPDLPWEAKKGGSWCPPSLGLPYLSDQPLPFSFLLCVPALAVGPHACPPFGLRKEQSVHLAGVGVCWGGGGMHSTHSLELSIVGRGWDRAWCKQVQTGFPPACSASQRRPEVWGEWGGGKRGGEKGM